MGPLYPSVLGVLLIVFSLSLSVSQFSEPCLSLPFGLIFGLLLDLFAVAWTHNCVLTLVCLNIPKACCIFDFIKYH